MERCGGFAEDVSPSVDSNRRVEERFGDQDSTLKEAVLCCLVLVRLAVFPPVFLVLLQFDC